MNKIIIRLLEVAFPNKWKIESIPSSMHFKNVRAVVTASQWRKLATYTHAKAGNRCEQCGSTRNLECHEKWSYDITTETTSRYSPQSHTYVNKGRAYTRERKVGVMRLVALVSLCKMCHNSKHPHFAKNQKYWKWVKKHIQRVYKISSLNLFFCLYKDKQRMRMLNKFNYRLDLTLLNNPEYHFLVREFGRNFTSNETNSCRKVKLNS